MSRLPLLLMGIGCLFLMVGACTGSVSSPAAEPVEPLALIVDTDMAIDDVRALMFLFERDDVDVVAVSVVGSGVARCPQAGVNARALLDRYGLTQVPVACGQRAPLSGFNTAPTAWRDEATALSGMDLESSGELPETEATDLLLQTIEKNPGVTILALGPLTNLAPLLATPGVANQVNEVRIMGGAIDVGGNIFSFTNFGAEFNIWIDPNAAQQVLNSGVPISFVPLDVTNHVPITPATIDTFAGAESPSADLLNGFYEATPLAGGVYHWDDLAAVSLVDPAVATFEEMQLAIDIDPESDGLGRTVRVGDGLSTTVSVAMTVDPERFERVFFETVTGTATSTQGQWTPTATIEFDGTNCSYDGPDPVPDVLEFAIVNSSNVPALGVLVGVYDSGTTLQQAADFAASKTNRPPPFLDLLNVMPLPTDTDAVWVVSDMPTDVTLWCALDPNDVRELAGQRLPT